MIMAVHSGDESDMRTWQSNVGIYTTYIYIYMHLYYTIDHNTQTL